MSDLIDRQVAIEALEREKVYATAFRDDGATITPFKKYNRGLEDGIEALKALPSAQPERKEGRWINGKCSNCGEHAPYWPMASTYYQSNFCPNCGAKMKED